MQNRKRRAIALKQVGISKRDVEEYLHSSRKFFLQYKGRQSNVVTQEMLSKISVLADIRRSNGVEIAGVIFENNLNVTFIFYVDDDPYDAFYEKNCFMNSSDFEKELNRQIESNFIPKIKWQKQVIYKYGYEVDLLLFNK